MVLLKSALLMVARLVMMVVRGVKLKVVLMVSVHQRGVVLNAELVVVVDVMETMVASVIVTSAKVDSAVRE